MKRALLFFLVLVAAAEGQGRLGTSIISTAGRMPSNPPPAPPPGTGVIEGTVRDKASGAPIPRAAVTIGVANGQLSASTDEAGHFVFRALPPGWYSPTAQAPGYTANANSNRAGDPPKPVQLDQNNDKAKVELFLYPTATVSGRVINDAGEPLRGCQIGAIMSQPQSIRRRIMGPAAFATTNASGEYQLRGLQRGRYALSVRCDGVMVLPHAFMKRNDPAVPRLIYPYQYLGGADLKSAQKLAVETGAHAEGIDIRLARVQAARLEGVLQGIESQEGVMIWLQPSEDDSSYMQRYNTGVDNQTGKFTFADVAPGEYRLVAAISNPSPSRFLTASQIVNVQANARNEVEVALTPLPSVSGTVVEAPPPEPAQTSGGVGIAGTQAPVSHVFFEPLEQPRMMPQTMAPIEKDGTFRLPAGLPPGHWRLHVNGRAGYVKSMRVDDTDVIPGDFVLGAGVSHTMRIEMGSNWGEVDVMVESVGDNKSGDLFATVIPNNDESLMRSAPVQQDGSARLQNVAPGHYRLFVLPQRSSWSFAQDPRLADHFSSRGQSVDVTEGGKVQVSVSPITADEIATAFDEIG